MKKMRALLVFGVGVVGLGAGSMNVSAQGVNDTVGAKTVNAQRMYLQVQANCNQDGTGQFNHMGQNARLADGTQAGQGLGQGAGQGTGQGAGQGTGQGAGQGTGQGQGAGYGDGTGQGTGYGQGGQGQLKGPGGQGLHDGSCLDQE